MKYTTIYCSVFNYCKELQFRSSSVPLPVQRCLKLLKKEKKTSGEKLQKKQHEIMELLTV